MFYPCFWVAALLCLFFCFCRRVSILVGQTPVRSHRMTCGRGLIFLTISIIFSLNTLHIPWAKPMVYAGSSWVIWVWVVDWKHSIFFKNYILSKTTFHQDYLSSSKLCPCIWDLKSPIYTGIFKSSLTTMVSHITLQFLLAISTTININNNNNYQLSIITTNNTFNAFLFFFFNCPISSHIM